MPQPVLPLVHGSRSAFGIFKDCALPQHVLGMPVTITHFQLGQDVTYALEHGGAQVLQGDELLQWHALSVGCSFQYSCNWLSI